jgi:hypothetical protein
LDDVPGEFCRFAELFGVITKGLLDGEGVVGVDVEIEVGRFAVKCRVAGDAETFGVVEYDGGVAMGDVRIKPGKSAASEFYLGKAASPCN